MSSFPPREGMDSYVQWGLLNVDSSIIRDMGQLMLRYEIYGEADPSLTLFKELIKRLVEIPVIPIDVKHILMKKLTALKLIKVY
jgi:hypothetical protein